ncbi:MAG: CAP domain-containing protein, partial [Acetobacteraceae bacterium]|nr:CAP domain-containing protein [Acetobacteraceae bacterium]
MAQPTDYEQYLLELVNRARANPGAEAQRLGIGLNDGLSPGTIAATAKQPLAFNPQLIDAARDHSAWMLATDTFSHTGAGGSSPGDRMTAAGYSFTGSWTWGENISIRWGSGTALNGAQVEAFHDGLFRSAGHRTNILNDGFKEIGTGLALGEYRGSTGATATEVFARSGTGSFLTGVAFDDRDGDRFYDPGEGLGGLSVQISGGGGTFQTTTWGSGGYQIKLAAGTYSVTFSGGGLASPVTKSVTIGSANVKLDLDTDADAGGGGGGGLVLTGTTGNDVLTGGAG